MEFTPTTIHEWMKYSEQYPCIEAMPAKQAAAFVQFLVRHEVSVGGPYVFHTSHDEEINIQIRKYLAPQKKLAAIPNRQSLRAPWDTLYTKTLNEIGQSFSISMRQRVRALFQAVSNTDSSMEISGIAKTFYYSLSKKPVITQQALKALSIANCYMWLSYSLTDKIIDTASDSDLTPLGHYFSRKAFLTYEKAGIPTKHLHRCSTITDKAILSERHYTQMAQIQCVDSIITWRVLPSVSKTQALLSKKSYAHLAGPATILALSDYPPTHKKIIMTLLEHYCAMRQLTDDLHDWKDDLKNKQTTHTIAQLLRDAKKSAPGYTPPIALFELQRIFFTHTVLACTQTVMRQYITTARQLQIIGAFSSSHFIDTIVAPHLTSLQTIQNQQRYAQEFLKHYATFSEE